MENLFDIIATNPEEEKIKIHQKELKAELKSQISTELANKTEDKKLFGTTDKKELIQLVQWIKDIIKHTGTQIPRKMQKELVEELVLEITSLGKLHELVLNKKVSEIMVVAKDEVWVEIDGRIILSDVKFVDDDEVMELATKIATNVGRTINNSKPIVDARLPDGSRVHIVLPPVAMKGVTITIRKFFEERLGMEDLIRFGSITAQAAKFLENSVIARANLIVSGGTGSGKTTTLNIVSNFVPNHERIITIEDSAELQMNNDHIVKLESRDANAEGKGAITIRELVKASLRMRPDRVIVGEVRDGSAFDLLQAMNTGHDGSMSTTHANSPQECIDRIDNLVLQAGLDMPSRAIRRIIAGAVDIVVQIQRLSDGSRKIIDIAEVTKYDPKTENVLTESFFKFEKTGKDAKGKIIGELKFTGYTGTQELQDKFEMYNLNLLESLGIK